MNDGIPLRADEVLLVVKTWKNKQIWKCANVNFSRLLNTKIFNQFWVFFD